MNTRTSKFLAVLAVLVMAFAGIAVFAPMDQSSAAVTGVAPIETDSVTTATSIPEGGVVDSGVYYLDMNSATEDKTITGSAAGYTLYVIPGTKTLTIADSGTTASKNISIYVAKSVVTEGATTTTTFYADLVLKFTTTTATTDSVTLSLSMPSDTVGPMAVISSLTGFLSTTTTDYGAVFNDSSASSWTFYAKGANTPAIALETGDSIIVAKATVTATQAASSASEAKALAGSVTIADAEDSYTTTVTYGSGAEAKAMQITPSNAAAVVTLTANSGAAEIVTTAFADSSVFNCFKVGAKNAIGLIYGSGYSGSDATYVYGTVDGTIANPAAAVNLVNMTNTKYLSITVGSTDYRVKGTTFNGTINGPVVTSASGTLEFMKGTFTKLDVTGTTTALTIDEGVSVTMNNTAANTTTTVNAFGILVGDGTKANNAITTVCLGPNASVDVAKLTIANKADYSAATYEIKGILETNTEVQSAKLTGPLTIPEGITLTVTESLFLAGNYDLTVNGTLVVKANAKVITDTGKIVLGSTGEIQNTGMLGRNAPLKIQVSDDSYVTLQSVKGAVVTYAKDGTTGKIMVSGFISKVTPNISDVTPTVVLNGALVGETSVMSGIILTDATPGSTESAATLTQGSILTISTGALLSADVTLPYGATLAANGKVTGTIYAQTFIKKTTADIKDGNIDYTSISFVSTHEDASHNEAASVSGFAISVDRVKYSTTTSGTTTVYYDQRAYVSGNLKLATFDTTDVVTAAQTLTINGLAFVAEDAELSTYYSNGVLTKIAGEGYLVVEGSVSDYTGSTKSFVGAKFSLTSDDREIEYITGYAAGLLMVGVADEVIVSGATGIGYGVGSYTITDDITIDNGYSLTYLNGSTLTIPQAFSIYVKEGGALNANVIASLSGKVVVYPGGTCTGMTSSIYQVVSTATDGTVTYAGLAVVLAEAQPGDVITFPGENATAISSITIPSEVTLKVTGTLTVRQITVQENGYLYTTSTGSVRMSSGTTVYAGITNHGKIDLTAGEFTFEGTEKYSIVKSDGYLIYASEAPFTNATVDGVVYQNSSAYYVLTSIAGAIADGADSITIDGTYTDAGDVDLNGIPMTISATGKVTIGSLDITGTTLTVNGEFTGMILAQNGTEDDMEDAKLYVAMFNGTLSDVSTVNSEGLDEYTFKSGSILKGTILLNEGTLSTGYGLQGTNDTYKGNLYVSDDAHLIVTDSVSIGTDMKSLDIDGTLTVKKGYTLTLAAPLTIDGIADIKGTLAAAGFTLTLTGIMNIGQGLTSTGVFYINGDLGIADDATTSLKTVIIGSESVSAVPAIIGKMTLASNSYVIDYVGIVGAEDFTNVGAFEIAYLINDEDFVNVVAFGTVAYSTVLAKLYSEGIYMPGYDLTGINTIGNWTRATGQALPTNLTEEVDAYFYAPVQEVTLKTSWATGTSLYVDNVRITESEYTLTVGTHTVTATINPGYKGTIQISYDGTPLNGTITVGTEDDGVVLAVTGDISIDTGDTPAPSSNDNSLTTILLVVLVIMVVIMAAITVLRMMRS